MILYSNDTIYYDCPLRWFDNFRKIETFLHQDVSRKLKRLNENMYVLRLMTWEY